MALAEEDSKLDKLPKLAIVEILEEHPDLLSEAVTEAVEDCAMGRAIKEGIRSGRVHRTTVTNVLHRSYEPS